MSRESSDRSRREIEAKNAEERVGPLDLTILRHLSEKKGLGEIAKLTRVEPVVVGERVAKLQTKGYVSASGHLTDKGFKALDEQHD
ncbi:MAG: hypothetical protein ABR867_02840 [Nitrososphaerales archaeon]